MRQRIVYWRGNAGDLRWLLAQNKRKALKSNIWATFWLIAGLIAIGLLGTAELHNLGL